MTIETSAYYGQPAVVPFPFATQAACGTAAAHYGQPTWQLLGAPFAQPQLWGQFASPYPYAGLAGPAIGGWFGQPLLGSVFGGGAPLHPFGAFPGQAIGWPGIPLAGLSGLPGRHPLLEAYPGIPMTSPFVPYGFGANQIAGPLGGLNPALGQRSIPSGMPFQVAPPFAYVG